MNKFQYKEKDYAEEILSNGFTSKYIASELKILSKYYNSISKDETEIKQLLHDYCKNNLKGFNEAVHFKMINTAVKFGINKRNKLIQINKIDITENELQVIDQMELEHDYKRVVFTLLVLTRLSKKFLEIRDDEIKNQEYYFGGYKNYRELTSTSKITFNKTKKSNVKNIHDLIHILSEKGIVEITNNGNIKLLFMYDIKEDDDIVFSVDDYEAIGYFYDLYYGENRVKRCKNCNTLIKASNNSQEYCKECFKIHRKNYKKEKQREYRENHSVDNEK